MARTTSYLATASLNCVLQKEQAHELLLYNDACWDQLCRTPKEEIIIKTVHTTNGVPGATQEQMSTKHIALSSKWRTIPLFYLQLDVGRSKGGIQQGAGFGGCFDSEWIPSPCSWWVACFNWCTIRYSFEQNCMATNLEENLIINPIEQVDRSPMLIAAMVHQKEIPSALLRRRWSKDALTGANGTSIHIIDWRQRHCRLFCNYLSKQCNYTSFNPAA